VAIDNTTGVRTTLDQLRQPGQDVAQAEAGAANTQYATTSSASQPGAIDPSSAEAATGTASTSAGATDITGPDPYSGVDAIASQAGQKDAAALAGSAASAAGTADASASGYNAKTGEVDPTMTAIGQLDRMTAVDSPTMRRAAQQGMLTAARRGLQNSSFAAGAAQGAMVDRAAPLAQQDAQTNFQNLRANLDAENRAAEVSTGRETDIAALNAQLGVDVSKFNADQINRMEQLNTQLGVDVSKFNASEFNQMEALNAQLQTAVSQGNAEEQNRIRMQIAELDQASEIRNAELQQQNNQFNADVQNQMEQLNAQLQTAVNQGNAEAENRIKQQMADLQQQVEIRNAELEQQNSQFNAEAENIAARQAAGLETEVSVSNAQMTNAQRAQILEGNQRLNEQYLAGSQAMDLATIQGRYQQLIAGNNAAAMIYDSYLSAIGNAMSNHEITPGRVASYVNVMAQQLEGSLEMIDAMNTMDLGPVDVPGAASGGGTGATSTIRPEYEAPAAGTAPTAGTPGTTTGGTGSYRGDTGSRYLP
jgi:hypothetical protein